MQRGLTLVAGARPNFMKIAPLIREARARGISPYLIHTGQHFSPEMSQAFFEDLGIPEPDCNLGIGAGSQVQQLGQILLGLEPILCERRADPLIVVGDVTSTVAAALAGTKLGMTVAHVEAGLRSFDRTMPEEINRVLTDSVADLLFTTEPDARENLIREGIPPERVFFVGNVMIDTLLHHRDRAMQSAVLERLGVKRGEYALVTLHRPANVDDTETLNRFVRMLERLAEKIAVVFPVHPRTAARMKPVGSSANGNLRLVDPQRYLDFVQLMANARMVLTDSGGIQEETTILGVPCLTMRENTERPITISQGTNRLAGVDPGAILRAAFEAMDAPAHSRPLPELWDGRAAGRIFDVLERYGVRAEAVTRG